MLNGLRTILLALAAMASVWAGAPAHAQPQTRADAEAQTRAAEQAQRHRPAYTTERLSPEIMHRLLAEPIAQIEEGNFPEAERAFALQLADAARRHGPSSLAVGDLMVMFGVTIFNVSPDQAARRRGLDYLRRGVEAHAAILGANHPEVGLGYTDIGNAYWFLNWDNPPPEADAAFEQGWRIRSAALGRNHVEAASALVPLAKVRGLPSRTRGDPARIEASAALFRQAIADFGTSRVTPGHFGSISTRFDAARMYRSNGMIAESAEYALGAQADYRQNFAGDRDMCNLLLRHSFSLAAAFARDGHAAEAAALRGGLNGLPCFEGAAAYGPLLELILPEDSRRAGAVPPR